MSGAVANAIGKNNILIVVPCHRIIGSNKKLTGFSSGLDMKEYLLNLENIFDYKGEYPYLQNEK